MTKAKEIPTHREMKSAIEKLGYSALECLGSNEILVTRSNKKYGYRFENMQDAYEYFIHQ